MIQIKTPTKEYSINWKTFRQHKYKEVFVPGVKDPIVSKKVIPQKVSCEIKYVSNQDGGIVSAEVVCKKPDVFIHAKGRVESFAKAVAQLSDKKERELLYKAVFEKYPGYYPEKHGKLQTEINFVKSWLSKQK